MNHCHSRLLNLFIHDRLETGEGLYSIHARPVYEENWDAVDSRIARLRNITLDLIKKLLAGKIRDKLLCVQANLSCVIGQLGRR